MPEYYFGFRKPMSTLKKKPKSQIIVIDNAVTLVLIERMGIA